MLFFDVGVQFASIAAAGDAALLHAPLPVDDEHDDGANDYADFNKDYYNTTRL